MNLADAADIFTVVGGAAAAVLVLPAVVAVYQYFRNSRTQRTQWLVNLFERFYEKETYREVRRDLDWNDGANIKAAIEQTQYNELEERWNDYLNFFEMVAYFRETGELSSGDVNAMFEYWINQLRPFEQYLRENGYEKLLGLLQVGR